MLGRIARLLQARGTATTGSRRCLQQVRSKGDDSSSPSSPIGRVQSELAALYQSIDTEASQHFTNDLGMGSFSQRAAETLRDMQAAMKAAAGQRPGSSGSSTGSNLTASSVGPSLLHYADLLGQYNSYSASQRRQLLEGLQRQLLPRVNAMVGLPVPSPPPTSNSPLPQPQHRSSSSRSRDSSRRPAPAHPAVAASGVVDQQQQQQQPRPRALKRPVGPRRGPSAPETQRQPPQAAPEQQHVSKNQTQQQEQEQEQLQMVEQQQPGSAEAGAVGSLQQQQQPVLQDQPQQQQQQQKQQGVVRRRVGPPRSPGPPRRSSSPVSTTPISRHSSPAPAAAGEHPAPAGAAGQSVQPPQQSEQQQQQQQAGPFRSHMGGHGPNTPRGPLRVHSAPHGTLQPPAGPGAAPARPAAEQAAQASPQQQQQQQQSQVQPAPEASPSSSSSSSSSHAKGPVPARPLLRSVSASGPYLPRRHTPYPPAATQPELMRLHQQQRQQQQQQGLLPAWQLYWPLPEELGGPARPQQQQPVAAAAAAATATVPTDGTGVLQQQLEQLQLQVTDPAVASAADSASSSGSDTDEAAAGGSGNGSSGKGSTRDKALTEQKWQALLASARRHHEHLQQEQQRQQQEAAGELKQRSGAWLRLRQSRLTGSALANMLSWFDGQDRADHVRLWREKLGLQQPPPPNEKMLYGTRKEHHALSSYQQLAPHEMLQEMGFALWGSDSAHDWLAASPDGLITSAGLEGLSTAAAAGDGAGGDAVGVSEEVAAWVKQQTGSSLDGVLEIKCPYKASPQVGSPYLPRKMDPYYMPQVQVLCEVLEREWAVVYYWSEGQGSHMTLVHRDRDYFGLLWRAMADFWWRHLVPAKLLLEADPSATDTIERTYAPRVHPYRAEIIRRSKALVDAAPQRTFTAEETVSHAQPAAAADAAAAAAAEQPPAATTLAAADAAGGVKVPPRPRSHLCL